MTRHFAFPLVRRALPGRTVHRVITVVATALLIAGSATAWAQESRPEDGPSQAQSKGQVRTYFVGANQVVWDYAPDGANRITGEPFDDDAKVFVERGPGRIGPRYEKCIYQRYPDGSFLAPQQRPENERHLGFLGPVIRAEVGDTIKVTFRNNCPFPASMHPHGVSYDKESEGAVYSDGTNGTGDAIPPGGTHTYLWQVPERAGPGGMDGSSVTWMYHSHVDEVADVYSGLSGFLVVTAKGKAKPDGSPADVDHEVFSLFEVDDENSSPFLDANLARFAQAPLPAKDDEDFVESNLMHSVNGYVYGNGPMITLKRGERVRWNLMAMGTEVDLHTPHWHGNTTTINGMRTDVANLLPASMTTADMRPDAVGTWLFHCHVGDHIKAGMMARYRVDS